MMFTPAAEIIHLGGASSQQKKAEMMLHLRGSILFFFAKHRSRWVHGWACVLVALFFGLRVPYWLGRAIFSLDRRNEYLERTRTLALGVKYAIAGGDDLRRLGRH